MTPRRYAFSAFEHLLDDFHDTAVDEPPNVGPGLPPAVLDEIAELWATASYASARHLAAAYLDPDATAEQPAGGSLEPVRRPLTTDVREIASELGLGLLTSVEALAAARRAFAVRNHPDSAAFEDRAAATLRMAIANALVDQARARLLASAPR